MIKRTVLVNGTIGFVLILVLVAIVGLMAVCSSNVDTSNLIAAAKKALRRIERGVILKASLDSTLGSDTRQAVPRPAYLESIAGRDSEGIAPNISRLSSEEPVLARSSTATIAIATDRYSS